MALNKREAAPAEGHSARRPAQNQPKNEKIGVKNVKISPDEDGMRIDNWFKYHYPALAFGQLQRLLRSGQIRLNGGRVKGNSRLLAGQELRIPPLALVAGDELRHKALLSNKNRVPSQDQLALERMTLYQDDKIAILNKPCGLAVQGGSNIQRHIDAMLEAWRNKKGEKPRLVHRIDRDTSGLLIIAKTRKAAQQLTEAFRERKMKKLYWALVSGVPRQKQAKLSHWLCREQSSEGDKMVVCSHGAPNAVHAISYYRIIDSAARQVAWLELEPYTGRMHQLRVQMAHWGHAILGDSKYFPKDRESMVLNGMQNKLHLHARYISFRHPNGQIFEITAPLPPHMEQSFNLLAFAQNN